MACFFAQGTGTSYLSRAESRDALRPMAAATHYGVSDVTGDDVLFNESDKALSKKTAVAHRKSLPLTFHYSKESEPQSVLAQHWQEKKEESQFLYTQQVGLDPATYIGIIGDNSYLIREFVKEFTLSGLLWKASIKHNLLFVLGNETVEVYVDKGRRPHKRLSQNAKSILKAAEEHIKGLKDESVVKQKHLALVADVGFFKDKISEYKIAGKKGSYSFASGQIKDSNKYAVIYGAIKQKEAEELIKELMWYRYKSLNKLGHIFIRFIQDAIVIESEHKGNEAKQDILDFIEGFRDIIAFSDTHIAGKGMEDNFGAKKEKELVEILDKAIARRSLIVINGDFMELWQGKYGNIKRNYSLLFAKLRKARHIIYIAGNHDEDILQNVTDKHRSKALEIAKANIVKKASKNNTLNRLIRYSHIKRLLQGYEIILSSGFSNEAIALEGRTFYVDERILKIAKVSGELKAMRHLFSLIEDRLQSLHEIVKRDLGGKQRNDTQKETGWHERVEVLRHYLDEYRRFYFEHGHIPDPFNYQTRIGRVISWVIGRLEQAGWKDAEYDLSKFSNNLVNLASRILPKSLLPKTQFYAERALALGRTLGWYIRERELPEEDLTIFFGHTHVPVDIGEGPINALLKYFISMLYGNTGTWSSAAEKRIKDYTSYRWQLKNNIVNKKGKEKTAARDIADRKFDEMKYWFLITAYREMFLKNGYTPVPTAKQRYKVSMTKIIPSVPYVKNIQSEKKSSSAGNRTIKKAKNILDKTSDFRHDVSTVIGAPMIALERASLKFKGPFKEFYEQVFPVVSIVPKGNTKITTEEQARQTIYVCKRAIRVLVKWYDENPAEEIIAALGIPNDKKYQETINTSTRTAKSLRRMIKDLKDVSEGIPVTIQRGSVDINGLVSELVAEERIEWPGILIQTHLSKDLKAVVGDRALLSRVLSNLIRNAREAGRSGRRKILFLVSTKLSKDKKMLN